MSPEKRHTRDHHGRFPCLPDDGCRTSPEKRHSQNPTLAQHVQATREANPPHAEAQVRKSDRFGALRAPCGRNDLRAKDFNRTGAPARQKRGKSGRNPPHRAPSAPERTRILAREPESTARSLFRAKNAPNSQHEAAFAPAVCGNRSTKAIPRQEFTEFTAQSS